MPLGGRTGPLRAWTEVAWGQPFSSQAQSDGTVVFQFEFECRARGADILAYPPVVAGGNRSNTLHYVKNNQLIKVHRVLQYSFLPCQALSSLHGSLSLSQQPLFPGAGRVQQGGHLPGSIPSTYLVSEHFQE